MKQATDFAQAAPPILASLKGRSFLATTDFSRPELSALLDLAIQHKHGWITPGLPLAGKSVALVFFNPSLRTRASMIVAIQQLGGVPVVLDVGQGTWSLEYREGVVMDGDKTEHIKEAAAVLGTYVHAIGVRSFPRMQDYDEDKAELVINAFKRYSHVPILNLESSMHHPLQGLADVMTIKEKFGTVDQRKVVLTWAYHPKPLPMAVPNTFALVTAQYGMDLTIAHPPEYELDPDIMAEVQRQAALNQSRVRVVHDMAEACRGAEVVYAKSWGSRHYYGRLDEERQMRQQYKHWIVTPEIMARTNNGYFMHCLPVRRNVVVADEVLDSPRSIVVHQASNRLHIQKTLLSLLLQ
ncbi:MAG: N-acetylornithine carbamoyltransferase [Acidobacteriota bacterium]|nr:N-acetylornithine carbamoyltransferase [Blastocatellia bacterium]MDW8239786.1 N-acetylornithine carbamoyltransferase [Acidobacteriota bacterium]